MQRTLWLILVLYVVLAIACSALNPLFEAPDEQHHYFTARQIAQTRRLPVYAGDGLALQEAAQPPLYYVLSALIIAPTDILSADTRSAEPALWPNPYVRPGHLDSEYNLNAFAHTPAEAWPWRGYALGVHAVRLLSVLLGLGTLLCIYGSGRLLWPDTPQRALLATALVGFLPQYVFLHSSVSNDTAIIFFCSAALWQLIRLWQKEVTSGQLLALGITIGLATLTKTTGVLLLAVALPAIAYLAWRAGRWRTMVKYIGLLLLPVALVSGWLFWRNWTLYGDALAISVFVERAGGDRHWTVGRALADLDRVWQSSVAVFGWMNVTAPGWVYAIWNGLVVVGVLGWGLAGLRALLARRAGSRQEQPAPDGAPRYDRRLLFGLLALWPVLVFAAWLRFMMQTPADQGRLLFPALLPLSLALAYGLVQWHRRWSYPLASLLALSTTVYCVFWMLPQTYVQPALIEEAHIPPEATRLDRDMGLGLDLVASEVAADSARPGDPVDVTLYWRKRDTNGAAAILVPEILGRAHTRIGHLPDAYHGGGIYPSNLWPVDAIVVERIRLPLADEALTPTQGRVFVHLDGQEAFVEAGAIKIVPRTWPEPEGVVVARLGEGIILTRVEPGAATAPPGDIVPVSLQWQIEQAPGRDLTTFVHLGDPTQPPLAQADGPALGGDYASRFWQAGEVFDDRYDLHLPADLPSGSYPIHLGLYDPLTGQRLPVWIDGVRQPHDAVLVGWIKVE